MTNLRFGDRVSTALTVDCILGSGNPSRALGTQPKWVGPPNLADVLGRTKYPKPSLGSQ
jgi:hypothetical protein